MFFWLLLKNRLKPKGVLRRKNNVFLDSYHCELCLFQKEEKLKHLFFSDVHLQRTAGIKSGLHSPNMVDG
jgi:hypothetical protein